MKKLVPYALATILISGFAAPLVAKDADDDGGKAVAAETEIDHEAIAADYENEAQRAKANGYKHRKMGDSYAKMGGAAVVKHGIDKHCYKLADAYEATAKESENLAKAHREMAKSAK